MLRLRKSDVHSSSTELQDSRPRQSGTDVQADTGLLDGEERDSTAAKGRQRKERGSSVSDTKNVRQEKTPLGLGNYGEVRRAKSARDVAEWYWKAHKLVVVPAERGKKFPIGEWGEVEGYNDAIDWWGNEPTEISDYNYACLTGPSNVVVIDFDDKEKGRDWSLDTLTVETPRGYHYYIRTDIPVNSASYKEAKVDIRAIGGIAILPPSLGTNALPYRLTNKPIIQMEKSLLDDYLVSVGCMSTDYNDGPKNEQGWFPIEFDSTRGKGERDNTCTKLAGYLLNYLGESDTVVILEAWNGLYCNPPLTSPEVIKCVRSIARKEQRNSVKESEDAFESELQEARNSEVNIFKT